MHACNCRCGVEVLEYECMHAGIAAQSPGRGLDAVVGPHSMLRLAVVVHAAMHAPAHLHVHRRRIATACTAALDSHHCPHCGIQTGLATCVACRAPAHPTVPRLQLFLQLDRIEQQPALVGLVLRPALHTLAGGLVRLQPICPMGACMSALAAARRTALLACYPPRTRVLF